MSKRAIENIKSVILVVLFLITILLLYLIWGDTQTGRVQMSDLIPGFGPESEETDPKDLICPNYIYYTAGDGAFRPLAFRKQVFDSCNELLKELCISEEVMATEITGAQYSEAVQAYESLEMDFSYSIPFAEYCRMYEINRSSAFANIAGVSRIAFSAAAKDSALIADEENRKYYRILSGKELSRESLNEDLFWRISYYDAKSILGLGEGKLFPLSGESRLTEAAFVCDYDGSEEKRQETAKEIFGENFSFVRQIADSFENYTFMYGYGQKSLSLNADGSIEYKAEAQDGESQGFFGDLKIAAEFAKKVGGLGNQNGGFVLKAVKTAGSGKSAVHTFFFDQQNELGFDICKDSGYAMTISVEKGSVCMFSRNTLTMQSLSLGNTFMPVSEPANALAAAAGSSENLETLAESYETLQPALYAKDGMLIPVWSLKLNDNSNLCFDLYSGERVN